MLERYWPVDLDQAGMVRDRRLPLGLAAKTLVRKHDIDFEGNEAASDGWYYLWVGGIHLLCGHEGLCTMDFQFRPFHQEPLVEGLVWKKVQ